MSTRDAASRHFVSLPGLSGFDFDWLGGKSLLDLSRSWNTRRLRSAIRGILFRPSNYAVCTRYFGFSQQCLLKIEVLWDVAPCELVVFVISVKLSVSLGLFNNNNNNNNNKECKNNGDTSNNWSDWHHLEMI